MPRRVASAGLGLSKLALFFKDTPMEIVLNIKGTMVKSNLKVIVDKNKVVKERSIAI